MSVALSFVPFIAFAVLNGPLGAVGALLAAALASAALVLRGLLAGAAPKILELGSLVLFIGLALWSWAAGVGLSIVGTKLAVDVGLLVIVLFSMATGRPFTLQYARERVPRDLWDNPRFLWVNQVITGVWALNFLAVTIVELAMLLDPAVPAFVGMIVMVAALAAAIRFTQWYPKRAAAR
jgi:hypothetical protein